MEDVRQRMDRGVRMAKKGREARASRKMENRISHWNGDDGGTRSRMEGVGGWKVDGGRRGMWSTLCLTSMASPRYARRSQREVVDRQLRRSLS
jgi:hypothetical protein